MIRVAEIDGGKVMRVRVRVLIAALLPLAAVVAIGPSAGAVAQARPTALSSSFSVSGRLDDVAALSPRSAWAVGASGVCRPRTLIARWNGSAWRAVQVPAGPRHGELYSVAATSARDAWAAGFAGTNIGPARALMLHWDGKAWKPVALPSGAGDVTLSGVAATSARHAWAVGYSNGFTADFKAFVLQWDGRAWRRVRTPSPRGDILLSGVAATSARNVWVVGTRVGRGVSTGLILHWNGAAWTRVRLPALPPRVFLGRVAAISARAAWVVGVTGSNKPLILRWNGAAWRQVAVPGITGGLFAVTAVSARDAWAVGATRSLFAIACAGPTARGAAATKIRPLIFHWNGTTWKPVTAPAQPDSAVLGAVAATSAGNAWAVGGLNYLRSSGKVLVLRWNGNAWR